LEQVVVAIQHSMPHNNHANTSSQYTQKPFDYIWKSMGLRMKMKRRQSSITIVF
jgi:hypothetical protein